MLNWITYLQSANLSAIEKAVYSLLAEMSCSPWKFELLWDCWPELKTHTSSRKSILLELAALGDPQLTAFGNDVLETVTIFEALVGDSDDKPAFLRAAYKCA